jgi:hypothetical protein
MTEPNEEGLALPAETQEIAEHWNAAIGAHLEQIKGLPLTVDDVTGRFIMYAACLIQAYRYEADMFAVLMQVAARADIGFLKIESCGGRKDN